VLSSHIGYRHGVIVIKIHEHKLELLIFISGKKSIHVMGLIMFVKG